MITLISYTTIELEVDNHLLHTYLIGEYHKT